MQFTNSLFEINDSPAERVKLSLKYFCLHLLVLISGYVIFALLTHHHILVSPDNFNNWDSSRYYDIVKNGYYYSPGAMSTVAFFPGFPYLWKFMHLGIFGIIAFNTCLFLVSLLLIAYHFNISPAKQLLYCCLPSVFFIYMPYSEALFFFTATVLFIGLEKENFALAILGFILCSLTRSAANVFLPAIILMELFSGGSNKARNMISYSIACIGGVFIVAFIQHYQTGEWLGFLKTQKQWGHFLQWPKFPLGTTETMKAATNWPRLLFFDAGALALGLLSLITAIYMIWQCLVKQTLKINRAYFFAALYVGGVTIVSMAFKGKSIYSLNRYIVPTVFCFLFLVKGQWANRVSWKHILLLFVILTPLWFAFNSYTHILAFLRFAVLTLYFCLMLAVFHKDLRIGKTAFIMFYIINIVFQLHLLFNFMDCEWVA